MNMWSSPFQSHDSLSAFGPIQPSIEIPAEQEEALLTEDELVAWRGFHNMLEAEWEAFNIELDSFLASVPSSISFSIFSPSVSETDETNESPDPRRRQRSAAPSPEPTRPSPPVLPSPPVPGAWDRGRACVVNATNTYWSYGREPGYSQETKTKLEPGERVYKNKPDGSLRWAVFEQQARSTLAAQSQLDQMVVAVGGDPASFRTRVAKADYVLDREAPIDVVREEDKEEMFSVSFPVHLGQPASGFFWGVGRLDNGTLTMTASTQRKMERF